MNKPLTIFALAAALAATSAAAPASAAQLYRWVDDKGNVEWRDTPPPPNANAKKIEQRNIGSNTIETSALPYSVQQAVKNYPVTLWVFDCGEPCNRARSHLQKRGVPYTERNAQKEGEALVKLMGGTEVPVLIVGTTRLKGYLETDWDAALDNAGYPKSASTTMKAQAAKSSAEATAKSGAAAKSTAETAATKADAPKPSGAETAAKGSGGSGGVLPKAPITPATPAPAAAR